MSKQVLKPGGMIETITPDEMARLIPHGRRETRIRVNGTVQLNASGSGTEELYTVPAGMKFELRRVSLSLSGNIPSDPNTGNVLLNTAGKYIALLRSGSLIEYAQPQYGAAIQVPGIQSWSGGQGPHLQNKEVLEVAAVGLTASLLLSVYAEGDLIDEEVTGNGRRRA